MRATAGTRYETANGTIRGRPGLGRGREGGGKDDCGKGRESSKGGSRGGTRREKSGDSYAEGSQLNTTWCICRWTRRDELKATGSGGEDARRMWSAGAITTVGGHHYDKTWCGKGDGEPYMLILLCRLCCQRNVNISHIILGHMPCMYVKFHINTILREGWEPGK